MDVRMTCPLGSECESVKDGYVERCSWYTQMRGQDATGEEHNDWKCAITWFPILQVEQSQSARGVAASVQSLRNETTKRQDMAMQAIGEIENVKVIKSQ